MGSTTKALGTRATFLTGAWCGALAGLVALSTHQPPPVTIAAQDSEPVVVRVESRSPLQRNRVVRYSVGTRSTKELYRSEGLIPRDVTVSPDGRYLSFVEVIGPRPRRPRLVVLELSTNRVHTMDLEVRVSTWCCGGGKLAVVTGPPFEGGIGFLPERLLILDMESGTQDTLAGVAHPYQLHWAPFDSSLYIKSAPGPEARGLPASRSVVHRYDPSAGRISPTQRRGIFFSPDGRYYFDSPGEGTGFKVYRSSDDREVGWALPKEFDSEGPEGEWMPGSDHALVFIEREPLPQRAPQRTEPPRRVEPGAPRENPRDWNVVVEAETGRVTSRFQGSLRSGWKSNAKALILVRPGGVELIQSSRP